MNKLIPVSQPLFDDKEAQYVNDALSKGALSGFYGEYLPQFEKGFAQYCDCAYGISTTSGTTALHLAMAALGICQGDEVLVSTLTSMGTIFAILHTGAKPVPVDIEHETWNMNPDHLESKINPRTKAILVVHLFGHPADMDPILSVAQKHRLHVIEDAAEAHGALYKNRKTGSIGTLGCFSFYANKIITTGEGGMITTNHPGIAEKARTLKNLAFGDANKFMHKTIGYNYRMTNLQAAVGCAQLEKIETIIAHKRRIARFYTERFKDIDILLLPVEKPYARNVYWMYHVVLAGEAGKQRDRFMQELKKKGIETREGFIPYNLQDIFINKGWTHPDECPEAKSIAGSSFYLPSGPVLSEEALYCVTDNVIRLLKTFEKR